MPVTFTVEITANADADIAEIWEYIALESVDNATLRDCFAGDSRRQIA